MKRFIDLRTQLYLTDDAENNAFAFFCTVRDKFETFTGSQTWSSKEEFLEDYDGDDVERYLALIPEDWGKTWKDVIITIAGKELKNLTSVDFSEQIDISNLETDLLLAVQEENYEKAADIKRRIEKIKK